LLTDIVQEYRNDSIIVLRYVNYRKHLLILSQSILLSFSKVIEASDPISFLSRWLAQNMFVVN